jgi:transposase
LFVERQQFSRERNQVKGWPMYQDLQQLKAMGLNKSQVKRRLGIDWKTVDRYWKVTPDEFSEMRRNNQRTKKLEKYEDQIVRWLQEHPDISSAQVHDWLKEHYPDYHGKERTLRRYVASLRIKHGIKKSVKVRQYQATEELPMGYQAQVDLGFINLKNTEGQKVKLTGFGLVLSRSRQKYVEWEDKPLTTARFIHMHYRAFEFMGGVPEEIVYDQDRLLAISENSGDVIFTAEFERFRQQMGFRVYLCRKNDPETKGKIEAVIKYAKNNYARHRIFDNITDFNQGCIEWLARTGNANIHGTTKMVPAEVFKEEQKHLKPIPNIINQPEEIVTRQVRKDNTIWFNGNRYTLPLGSYYPEREVVIKEDQGLLSIFDLNTGEQLAIHRIALEKGKLISNNNHKRDHSAKIAEFFENTLANLGGSETAVAFLKGIRKEKPRYIRDQYDLINRTIANHDAETIFQADRGLRCC